MNHAAPPTLADRLVNVPTGRLAVRLSLARTAAESSQTRDQCARALSDVDAIRAEMARRGLKAAA